MIDEHLLSILGVHPTKIGEKEIQAHCPVHRQVTGKEDRHPSWYMNRTTGLWICFSCESRGSLFSLAEMLGVSSDEIGDTVVEVTKAKIRSWSEEARAEVDTDKETVYVSEYAFSKNPLPPKAVRRLRDVSKASCEKYNVRWDTDKKCWLFPIYSFIGEFIGWQEKSVGYFSNVPTGVKKSDSLFGLHQHAGKTIIVVESPMDVLRIDRYGLTSAVATYGAHVSKAQLECLIGVAETVILAFDNDKAGSRAADYAGDYLTNRGMTVKYFQYLGIGKDPGEVSVEDLEKGVMFASSLKRPLSRCF